MKSLYGIVAAILLAAGSAFGAEPELGLVFARSTDSGETDVARLTYRRSLAASDAWWKPTQLQFGAGIWRVPDIRGLTRRYDVSVTPVWRAERSWWYAEAGIGAYLLSHTINNETTRLPSAFEFGSHVGAGLRLGERGRTTIGVGLQHLSNAGLKQPNGGIDLYFVAASFRFD